MILPVTTIICCSAALSNPMHQQDFIRALLPKTPPCNPESVWCTVSAAAVRVEPSDLYDLAGEASREREELLGRQRLWQEQIAVVMR